MNFIEAAKKSKFVRRISSNSGTILMPLTGWCNAEYIFTHNLMTFADVIADDWEYEKKSLDVINNAVDQLMDTRFFLEDKEGKQSDMLMYGLKKERVLAALKEAILEVEKIRHVR